MERRRDSVALSGYFPKCLSLKTFFTFDHVAVRPFWEAAWRLFWEEFAKGSIANWRSVWNHNVAPVLRPYAESPGAS